MDLNHAIRMNMESNKNTKGIISDPVAYFKENMPGKPAEYLSNLQELTTRRDTLQSEFLEIDQKTRVLSKKIGECKKSGRDCRNLIELMKAHSKDKSRLNIQLQDLNKEILEYFEPVLERKAFEDTAIDVSKSHDYPDSKINPAALSIKKLGIDQKGWNSYVNSRTSTTIYHLADWRRLIKETFGHDSHYFYAEDSNNTIKGILPLIQLKSRLFGNFLVSMPYFNYGGAVADHPEIENMLMAEAVAFANSIGVEHIEFRDSIARKDYPARVDKVNMILPLPADKQILWETFSPKLRAQVNRPQRENPLIHRGREDLLDDFYQVFARNMRDLGTPVYSKSLFGNILKFFPDKSNIITITLNEIPVAAAFLLGHGETLEIPWASTNRDFNHLGINMLMYWEVLCFAIENGYQFFDFGRSSKDSGTYQFKRQWGALPRQSYWHYWLSTGKSLPSLNPDNPKYKIAIKMWKHLPIPVTKVLGPMIVKNLP